jgi:hypothetical protein
MTDALATELDDDRLFSDDEEAALLVALLRLRLTDRRQARELRSSDELELRLF